MLWRLKMRWLGFTILVFMTLLLFVQTAVSSLESESFMVPFLSIIVVGFVWDAFRELPAKQPAPKELKGYPMVLIAVVAGTLLAYFANIYLGLGAIIAASLVGLVGAATVKEYAVEVYCGAFVGMVSPDVLHDFGHTVIAGVIAGTIFFLTRDVFKGYGGKLGAIAFSSWILVSISSRCRLLDELEEFRHFGVSIMLFSLGAAVLTYLLSIRLRNGPVFASSLVGLLGGLLLPAFGAENAAVLAAVVMAASFVGMSSREKLRSEAAVLFSGLIMGIMFIYSANHFGGAGGKLGTLAFGSVASSRGLVSLGRMIIRKRAAK
ncbi:MAG: Uncharacterized protein XE02_0289 [Mesotoga infera]|jgi:hypothetical protein|uniref:Uncharacterized protein n=2 Tax=Mesotoga infera TaxID=1236046 RepID=A0A101I913_9BACT|nr:MAG: Uncharacterized protein XD86_0235 [Mesotoga infera]KUK90953.1 MAG: Uncharacterized protein XE02_0289 [Mesotoga infera]